MDTTLLHSLTADPHRISLREASSGVPRVDAAAGKISRVSLITADREAGGHGLWIDGRSLQTFHALLSGRRLKAYATHGSWSKDGTLDEIGFWDSHAIVGNQLLADFCALDAWRKHNGAEFDTLFELAEKLPGEFGASLSFKFATVWVLAGGVEVSTRRKFSSEGAAAYDPPAPAGALRQLPSVRAVEVYSADFVDQPAANTGLFRSGGDSAPPVSLRSAEISRLEGERAALSGMDEATAQRRGEITASIKKLRSGGKILAGADRDERLATLRATLAGVTGNDEAAAQRRGEIIASIKKLRAA